MSVTDPKLQQIIKRTTRMVRLAACKAVAHHQDPKKYPGATGPFEQLMLERVRLRKPDELERAWSRTRSFLSASSAARTRALGELAKVDLTSATPVETQAAAIALPPAARLERTHAINLIENRHLIFGREAPGAPPPPPPSPAPRLDQLSARIRRVKCIDETNPEWPGDDEILLGGTSIDESGAVKVITPFTVRSDFDDGESKTYSPPRTFTTFDLSEGGNVWPKDYLVSFYLCEQDNGGFPDWLKKAAEMLKDYVATAIGAAVGAAAGSVIPGLGTLVGAVVGAVLGFLVTLIVEWWEDDVFPVWEHWVSIKSYQHTFASGTHTSGEKTFVSQAHGGKYQVWYDFRVHE